jgi:hypothetical protein
MSKRLQSGIAVLILLQSPFSWDAAKAEEPSIPPSYNWGRGISWPDADFNLGGYVNASYQHPENQIDKLVLDELSLFLTWSPHQRIRFFSEVELDDWLSTANGDNFSHALKAERLYVDFLATETTTIRLGKYLTPVGRWNVIHAAPLIWSTTRPLVTEEHLFSSHLNGIMLTQQFQLGGQNLDVSVYSDHSAELDVLDSGMGFGSAFGGRANLELSSAWQVGLSFIDFDNEATPNLGRNDLVGVDLLWKKDGYEVSAEAVYRHGEGVQGQEKGLYLQGIAPVGGHVFALGRYEHLNGTHDFTDIDTHIGVAGLAWRPFVPLVFKAEYRFGTGNAQAAPSGFFTSIAMFF